MSTIKYADVQAILDEAVNHEEIGLHGAFWRTATRDEFVEKRVFGCPIIFRDEDGRFIGSESPLVRILRGPTECPAGRDRPQMPRGFDPVSLDRIQEIEAWIDAQCPS